MLYHNHTNKNTNSQISYIRPQCKKTQIGRNTIIREENKSIKSNIRHIKQKTMLYGTKRYKFKRNIKSNQKRDSNDTGHRV